MLSQKAEDTLNQFAAVKKAEVNFQTSLGNRKGQLGINLIGAFAERQNNAFGWQVRVYGAQQDGKGFNAGVFYRHITDNVLIGANAFVDYENHKLGNFYRYSIGGEAQNRYGSFAANYYVPITDEKRKDGGVIFSRKGYDAKLRLNIPNAKFLKAAVDYYNFGEEHGAESDDGFRYGAEAHLIPGLRIALLYDNGEKELGGEVSYIHTIGEVQQSQTANEQWTPDLFAAVSREHSQRIITATTGPGISLRVSAINTTFMAATIAGITTRTTTEMLTVQQVNAASVYFTARINNPANVGGFVIATTRFKFLITLPPASQITRPLFLTASQPWGNAGTDPFKVIVDNGSAFAVGFEATFLNGSRSSEALVITISEGSEDYITPAELITSTLTTRITMTILPITTTMAMTAFLTTTITLGLPTTNIGAAINNSHLPSSFPPSSFPPFPQVPKLALAAPVIPARRAGIQHNRVAIIQKPRRQYAQ